ncbi:MAG TPA: SDR family oxidoreductase [Steroidobacteraceae bacterium]|jgi:NAD(P)-dependent dehydrogenase (short-subunit alcohol dehydrogenase family)
MTFIRWVAAALTLTAALSHSRPAAADTVLITGANAGIGLEFSKEYAAKSWTVIATHHRSSTPADLAKLTARYKNVRVEKMDVSSREDVNALAAKLKGVPIDVLINNAGVYLKEGAPASQRFGQFDYALFDTIMAVNVRGPLMVMEAFAPNVKASHQKKFISISSTVGSLTQPFPGTTAVFYFTSKAALNKEMTILAQVLRPDGVTVAMIHPGQVRTERLTSVAPGITTSKDYIDASESVGKMIPTIDKLTVADSGHFMRYDGKRLPF